MKWKRLAARCTVAAYIGAFVMSDYAAMRPAAAEQQVTMSAAEVAQALGVGAPVAPAASAPRLDRPAVAGLPSRLDSRSPLSAAVLTSVGGPGSPLADLTLLADWDGREDMTADRGSKIEDASGAANPGAVITRMAVSAHTAANGFNENVYYYGDSAGNVVVGVDTNPNVNSSIMPAIDQRTVLNLPTILNAFGTLNSDSRVVVTGVCVSPVVDLTAWPNVNGSFTPFSGQIGESLIVTYNDFGGGLRLASGNQLVRSGVLAFPIADMVSPAAAPPAVQSAAGFPVTVGGSFGVVFSTFSNLAGCAVDDDGNAYFQQVDLQQFTGANIVKITRSGSNQDRALATSGIITMTTLNPTNGVYGTTSGPAAQVNRYTNYSGTSTTWGNATALAAGPGNTVYAALSASSVPGDATTGLFMNSASIGATPSMIVSLADVTGTFETMLPIALTDGIADSVDGMAVVPGVNNFRAFALGSGPDPRGTFPNVFGTMTDTLKLDFQVDYTIYAGLAVNEAREVYLVSGGTPAGVGRNPSPSFGEIQMFSDQQPADRRADYVDLRADMVPLPPMSGGNVGDGDSDRFDHIFAMAPLDGVSITPAGLAGLARGFLRYTNRLAPNPISLGLTLGVSDRTLGDNDSAGPIFFEGLDPGHQVAGGDDQNTPFRGDDSDGGGMPAIADILAGGFEFGFGANVPACMAPWNAFYLNADGNISFNAASGTSPMVGSAATAMLTGQPRIAPAWRDYDMSTRHIGALLNTFPVQAIGFAGVNQFTVRWINAPRSDHGGMASRNTFGVSLFDDGTGPDENSNQALNPANPIGNNAVPFDLQEGPTDNRHMTGPAGTIPTDLRPNGTAPFTFEYGRMDSGTALNENMHAVVAGYSSGSVPAGTVMESNLSEVGRTDVIGAGALIETAIFEAFEAADFDLRSEGNDAASTTPMGQPNPNRGILHFFGRGCAEAALKLTVAITGSGTVTGTGIACPGDCEETVSSGTHPMLTATPAAGYNLSSWVGCDMPSGMTCTMNMNASKLVTAQFTLAPPPPQPLQGTLNQSAYTTGQILTLTVTMDPTIVGATPVDAYIVFDLPGGAGSYSLQLPLGANVLVPGQVKIAGPFIAFPFTGVVFSVPLPGTIPAGAYQVRTFLTQAGTMTVIGSVDTTPFTFTP